MLLQGLFDGMPHIFWINLDRSPDRCFHMEHMLNRLNISHTRVRALDSKDPEVEHRLRFREGQDSKCSGDEQCKAEERTVQFCAASHILALMTYLNTSKDPYALIAEDDLDVEAFSAYWERAFMEYFADIPEDWAVAQVSAIVAPRDDTSWPRYLRGLIVNGWTRHGREIFWVGAGAYIVKREFAELMVKRYVQEHGAAIDLNQGHSEAVADIMMYSGHVVYTLPLLTYASKASTMHDTVYGDHVWWQTNSKRKLRWLWAQSQWYR